MNSIIRNLLLATFFSACSFAQAQSMLRVTCEGADVGAEVSVNGKFKGECPIDMQVVPGTIKLRVVKKADGSEQVFEQEVRIGEGVVKKLEVRLGPPPLTAAGHPISEQALKKEYESLRAQWGDKEYKLRHILVTKEEDAKAIIARLKLGEGFEGLAKLSTDVGSKDRGGDIGWSRPSYFVKPFAEAVVGLRKGSYTETPVKSEFGYHVIMLEDTRELGMPSFETVKPQLVERLQQQIGHQ